jgi:hypothetical protein
MLRLVATGVRYLDFPEFDDGRKGEFFGLIGEAVGVAAPWVRRVKV